MYSNSYAYIKLSGHLSKKIYVKKGTEQGHPLSPDLFKLFLSDLSPLLNYPNCPVLSTMLVSHLLWADDLILLSLDKVTTQNQLNVLDQFCNNWGIEINELKTQVVIFQKDTPLNANESFFLNGKPLEIVESYCYLGIALHYSGAVSVAQKSLKTKAMRAFFGLKRTVIRSKLSFKALTTLFDALIKPIVLYGAPIWAPNSTIWTSIVNCFKPGKNSSNGILNKISCSLQEKVHLSFLKWALGTHRKASNVGVWGETGRFPLIYQSIRLCLNYLKRVENLEPTSLVSAALKEQKALNLPWYAKIKPLLKLDEIYSLDHVSAFRVLNPKSKIIKPIDITNQSTKETNEALKESQTGNCELPSYLKRSKPIESKKFRTVKIIDHLTEQFKKSWEYQKSTSSKLSFYHSIKSSFGREPYLDCCKGFSRRYCTTQLRISAHDLQIERGRYLNLSRDERICSWCKTSMGQSKIEDESHVLFECDLYSTLRSKLITNLNKTPSLDHYESIQVTHESLKLTTSTLNKVNLMSILSPYCMDTDLKTFIHPCQIPEIKPKSPAFTSLLERRAYAINCICTYFLKCSEERKKLAESARKTKIDETRFNQIIINLL